LAMASAEAEVAGRHAHAPIVLCRVGEGGNEQIRWA
jgi:hypothetical protein